MQDLQSRWLNNCQALHMYNIISHLKYKSTASCWQRETCSIFQARL